MSNQIDYKRIIQETTPLIKEWISQQKPNEEQTQIFNDLTSLLSDIEKENDYSEEAYEDLRFLLRLLDNLSLQLKRYYNCATLDHYSTFVSSRYFESIEDHINLVMTTKRHQFNLEKYHYNPVPLVPKTRNFFPRLKTLYIYPKDDFTFRNDRRIKARRTLYVPYYMTRTERKMIQEWTGLKCSEILFHTDIDNWTESICSFNERIIGKKQLVFLIEEENGERFGFYMNNEVEDTMDRLNKIDDKSFYFNVFSNGRLPNPMKFELTKLDNFGYTLYETSSDKLIILGDLVLYKENNKNESYYTYDETNNNVDFHEIKNALCGKSNRWENNIHYNEKINPKRILVIQME